jgi:alpha-methylacyl-CoA racemase
MGPLAGVRVVEMAGLGPAPFAAMMLAELGADVVRIDRPEGGGLAYPPEFDLTNRGRPSVCIDVKDPRGLDIVYALVAKADVFIEGFRPGVAERLGVGPDELTAIRPPLVYGRMTGWGQTGPLASQAGHDINYIAITGALHAIGGEARPAVPLSLVGDYGGGALYLVVGVLAAVLEARQSGQGQVVDAAIVDGASHLATAVFGLLGGGLWSDRRAANLLDGGAPFYDVYETSDRRFLSIGPLEPQFYAEFTRLVGADETWPERTDTNAWPRLRTLIAARIAARTQAEWVETFEGSDACVTPVLSWHDAARHPQIASRQTLVEHHGFVQPAPAPRFSRTSTSLGQPPRLRGQDSRDTLLAWGISDVDRLIDAGVVIHAGRDEESPA